MTEIGMKEARRLYDQLPENVKKLKEQIGFHRTLLIDDIWHENTGALTRAYELVSEDEAEVRKLMGWQTDDDE